MHSFVTVQPPAPYTHTNRHVYAYTHTYTDTYLGFKCEKCLWLSPEALWYAYTEYHRSKMCQLWWNTVVKWQLRDSWCMDWLLQSWL